MTIGDLRHRNGKGKKRTKVRIVTEILLACKETHSMYQIEMIAKMHHRMLKRYMPLLVKNGLVEQQGDSYIATAKGREFARGVGSFPSIVI